MPRAQRRDVQPTRASPRPAPPQSYKDMKTPAGAAGNLAATPAVRAKMDRWHHDVNQVSGTLVLAFGKQGLSPAAARAAVQLLRATADDMERGLFNT